MKKNKIENGIIFREGSNQRIVEDIINKLVGIDYETGCWGWINQYDIQKIITDNGHKFSIMGNGSPFFNYDRGLGKKYDLEKDQPSKNEKMVRSLGWSSYSNTIKNHGIPDVVREHYKDSSCVFCGTSYNIVIDHKDKTKKDRSKNVNDYQPVCNKCNALKRDICNRCTNSKKRYDAKPMGYNTSYVEGTEKFSPSTVGCKGCYKHDPVYFRSKLSFDINKIGKLIDNKTTMGIIRCNLLNI